MLVDTGLGLPDAKERWKAELDALDGEVTSLFITHLTPIMSARPRCRRADRRDGLPGRPSTSSSVFAAVSGEGWTEVAHSVFGSHGAPAEVTRELIDSGSYWTPFIRYVR